MVSIFLPGDLICKNWKYIEEVQLTNVILMYGTQFGNINKHLSLRNAAYKSNSKSFTKSFMVTFMGAL